MTATAASPADGNGEIDGLRAIVRLGLAANGAITGEHGEGIGGAALAAAAADALRRNALGRAVGGFNAARVHHRDRARVSAAATGASDGHVDVDGARIGLGAGLGQAGDAGQARSALAAAATDALGVDGGRGDALRDDRAIVYHFNGFAIAGRAARSADGHAKIERRAVTLAGQGGGRCRAAGTAAAADAVGEDGFAEMVNGLDRSVVEDRHRTRIVSTAAAATDGNVHFLAVLAAGEVAGERQTAIAAAAADALGEQAAGLEAFCLHSTSIFDGSCSGDIAPAACAAHRNAEIVARRVRVEAQIGGERHAAIAAAAGRALCLNGVCLFLPGMNGTRIDDGYGAAGAPVSSTAADAHTEITGRFARTEIAGESETAIAAAAADTLRQDARGTSTLGPDLATDRGNGYRSRKAAIATAAADADAHVSALVESDIECSAETARAAAVTDALSQQPGGAAFRRSDRTVVKDRHLAAVSATAAGTADGD